MTFSVLNVAYPLAPVGPDAVGGAEQVLSHIDRALTAAGHHSVVIAQEGSAVSGTLLPIPRLTGLLSDEARREAQRHTEDAIHSALQRYRIDLIHFHGIDFWDYLPDTDLPVIATLHLPPEWYPPEIFANSAGNLFLHCVSAVQRCACPSQASLLPEIPNGVPIPSSRDAAKQDYALSLGRVCPEKGYHLAADACGRAGIGYLLAGAVYAYEAHQKYFEQELEPRLDGVSRRFIGPVAGERKTELLASAKCLLVPSLVAETSSLVAMEALAAGTPVIAFRSGALTELIEDGETGFLVHNAEEMADAIAEVSSISSEHCRSYAQDHFPVDRMTDAYLTLYSRLRRTGNVKSRAAPPAACATTLSEVLPLWDWVFPSSSATPFQSPDWLIPWWQCFAPGDPLILTVGDLGLLPLYSDGGTVRFMGTGITDYFDVIARPGREPVVAQACMDYLAEHTAFRTVDLDEIRPHSALLYARVPAQPHVRQLDSSVCPVVDLGNWSPPAKLAKNLRYAKKRLGGECTTWDSSRAPEFADHLISLHEKRWTGKTDGGVLSDPAIQRFHRMAIPRLAASGIARLHVLEQGGRTIAVLYCLAKDRRVYYYLGGFDPAYEAFSPGSLLIDYAIHYAIQRGDREFDFLRGAEPYKYVWHGANQTNRRLLITTCSRHTTA